MKNFLIAILAITFTSVAQAQVNKQSLSLSAGGGVHQLSYQLDNGTSKGGTGFTINLGYNHSLTPNWSISTGVGVQSFKSEATLNFLIKTPDVDAEGDAYELRTSYNGWKEEQSAFLIDIPLAATYNHSLNPSIELMASFGGKISIPINATYEATEGTITTTGYYSQWNVELSDLPEQGFTTFSGRPSGDLSLRPAFSLLADIGASYQLSDATSLYMGAYANYGLNSILKTDAKSIYQKDGTYNGLFASNQVDKLKTVAVGIKLGMIWYFSKKSHRH